MSVFPTQYFPLTCILFADRQLLSQWLLVFASRADMVHSVEERGWLNLTQLNQVVQGKLTADQNKLKFSLFIGLNINWYALQLELKKIIWLPNGSWNIFFNRFLLLEHNGSNDFFLVLLIRCERSSNVTKKNTMLCVRIPLWSLDLCLIM